MSTSNGRDSSLLLLPPHQRVAYTLDFYATGHTKCNRVPPGLPGHLRYYSLAGVVHSMHEHRARLTWLTL